MIIGSDSFDEGYQVTPTELVKELTEVMYANLGQCKTNSLTITIYHVPASKKFEGIRSNDHFGWIATIKENEEE